MDKRLARVDAILDCRQQQQPGEARVVYAAPPERPHATDDGGAARSDSHRPLGLDEQGIERPVEDTGTRSVGQPLGSAHSGGGSGSGSTSGIVERTHEKFGRLREAVTRPIAAAWRLMAVVLVRFSSGSTMRQRIPGNRVAHRSIIHFQATGP